jgi:Fuc2NAc and GlcNAc transferase
MLILWMTLVTFITAFILTGLMRVYALKKNIIDNPNERSSHTIPTPRGGDGNCCNLSFSIDYITMLKLFFDHDRFTLIGAGLESRYLAF